MASAVGVSLNGAVRAVMATSLFVAGDPTPLAIKGKRGPQARHHRTRTAAVKATFRRARYLKDTLSKLTSSACLSTPVFWKTDFR
jgi:hypothetical protein